MSAKDQKAADRQRRYRIREQARARALFAGATEIDVAWFGVNAEGEHVAIDYNGQSIVLIAPKRANPVDPSNVTPIHAKGPKIYAPKSWDPARWNGVVQQIRTSGATKEQTLSQVDSGTTIDDKQKSQARAVINALPDVPDWYDHLPLAKEG